MEILKLLDQTTWIESYDVIDYRKWNEGYYYRIKIQIENNTLLFVREYYDKSERIYSYHWQDVNNELIIRWDNAPHHRQLKTFPHHIHTSDGIFDNSEISLREVLENIQKQLSR